MKELMKSNIYDVSETIIVVGSCLKNMQLEGYKTFTNYVWKRHI